MAIEVHKADDQDQANTIALVLMKINPDRNIMVEKACCGTWHVVIFDTPQDYEQLKK